MKRVFSFAWILLILVAVALALTACDTYDVDKNGVPQFIEAGLFPKKLGTKIP